MCLVSPGAALQNLKKALDVYAVNIATNSDLYALSSAPLAPAALHAKLVADLTPSGFEYILRTTTAATSPAVAAAVASDALVRRDSPSAVRVVVPADAVAVTSSAAFATRTRRSQTMPDESHALEFLATLPAASQKSKPRAVEAPPAAASPSPAAVSSSSSKARRSAPTKQRRARHRDDDDDDDNAAAAAEPKTPEKPEKESRRKSRHAKKDKSDEGVGGAAEDSGDDNAPATPDGANWLSSPRSKAASPAELNDPKAFVHKLDAAQISAIANKQYAQFALPKKVFAYLDKPRDADVRRCYADCVRRFNEGGATALVDYLATQSADNAVSIAQVLLECEPQLDSGKLGTFLSDDSPLAKATLRQLMLMFPKLKDADILSALRRVIRFVRLPSEAQRLTRYLTAFCEAYVTTNAKTLKSADHTFTLCYALLSLNAATHSPDGGGKRFSNSQFEAMVDDVLKSEPALTLQMVRDMRENVRINEIVQQGDGMHCDLKRRGWLEVQQASSLFSSGWKRKWCVLAHNVLYVAKDAAATELMGELWTVPLRNVLAVRGPVGGRDWAITLLPIDGASIEYSAKDDKGVFDRRTAPKLVFSTSSAALLKHWIDDINEMVQQQNLLFVDDDRTISGKAAPSSSASKHRRRHK